MDEKVLTEVVKKLNDCQRQRAYSFLLGLLTAENHPSNQIETHNCSKQTEPEGYYDQD